MDPNTAQGQNPAANNPLPQAPVQQPVSPIPQPPPVLSPTQNQPDANDSSTKKVTITLGILTILLLIGYTIISNFSVKKPTSTPQIATPKTQSVVSASVEYKNPFDKSTQYSNPFSEYHNAIDDMLSNP